MEVLVCVRGFPISSCYKGVVGILGNKDVKERYGTITIWIFWGELDVGSIQLMCWRYLWLFSLLNDESIIHIPKTEPVNGGAEMKALALNSSMNRFAIRELRGTHGCQMDLLKILTLEGEVGILRQYSSKVVICWIDLEVLWGSRGSCSSFFLMKEIAVFTVTNVKRALTSHLHCYKCKWPMGQPPPMSHNEGVCSHSSYW